jgi:hypothetical protein
MMQRVAERSLQRMPCSLRRLLLRVGVAGAFVACAQSEAPDLTPYVDPTLPTVGSDRDPTPGKSSSTSGSSGDKTGETGNTGETGETSGSSGTSGNTTQSKDAGPPASNPSVPKPTQGEVLISEVMYDSLGSEPSTEWIEIRNTTSSARSLSGLVLVDGANRTHTIGANITIPAGAYKLLVRDQNAAVGAKVPASAILYAYGTGLADNVGIQLANASTGAVYLKDGSTIIARADYGGWFTQSGGASIQLKSSDYAASGSSSSWCLSASTWAAGSEKGTPGAACDCP